MESKQPQTTQPGVGYPTRCEELPAFDLVGFTKIVESGGELYCEARSDGRWEALRNVDGGGQTICGVASHDKACPKGRYRYTLAVRVPAERFGSARELGELYSLHVGESEWVVFSLECFGSQYGKLWQDNPYDMVRRLGYDFSRAVGLHIDLYAPSYSDDEGAMDFWMPVVRCS